MARLLALETSTEACSVALMDGDQVVERYLVAPREHMLRLLPMVDELLAGYQWRLSDLDAIAFGRGPGSFTGLRICLGVAQGLAFGADLPLVPISTLAVLAQSAVNDAMKPGDAILAAIDARMGEIYWGWFRLGDDRLVLASGPESVSQPEAVHEQDLRDQTGNRHGAGTGWSYGARVPVVGLASVQAACLPRAAALVRLAGPAWLAGMTVSAEAAVPVYLRDQVAWKK